MIMSDTYLQEISVDERGREIRINLAGASHFEAFGNYIKIYVSNRIFLYRTTMSNFLDELDPKMFFRVHRSFILNKSRIRKIQYLSKNEYLILMEEGFQIISGRKYNQVLKDFLSERY